MFYRDNYMAELLPEVEGGALTVREIAQVRTFDMRYDHRTHVFDALGDSLTRVCVNTLQPQRAQAIGQGSIMNDEIYLRPELEIDGCWPPEEYPTLSKEVVANFVRHEPFYRELAPRLEKFGAGVEYAANRLASREDVTNADVVEGLSLTYRAYARFNQDLAHLKTFYTPPDVPVDDVMQFVSASMNSIAAVINTLT